MAHRSKKGTPHTDKPGKKDGDPIIIDDNGNRFASRDTSGPVLEVTRTNSSLDGLDNGNFDRELNTKVTNVVVSGVAHPIAFRAPFNRCDVYASAQPGHPTPGGIVVAAQGQGANASVTITVTTDMQDSGDHHTYTSPDFGEIGLVVVKDGGGTHRYPKKRVGCR